MTRLDEAAFSAFYNGHARALWGYLYRVTGHSADADDIAQEAFLRVLRSAPANADDEQMRRYLYRIASNLVIDRWRSSRTMKVRAADDPPPDAAASGADPHGRREDLDVARIFATLAPRDRALLWLAYVEHENHADIANALRVRKGSVKVLLSRARGRLRDLLKAKGIVGS